jgi:tRNA pseudouridine55 synthase
VVDKPRGPTSHDAVGRVRKLFSTREVGHAGTLDPMATGVLVIAIGEATKLVPFLTADDKTYEARLVLGRATDTLDEEGTVTAQAEVPAALREALAELARRGTDGRGDETGRPAILEGALVRERARTLQVPPAFSAISVNGERAHERARRGEIVELAPRPVEVRSFTIIAGGLDPEPWLDVHLEVAKGYYVRSAARDLAETLGTHAHLSRLRRLRSGSFTVEDAAPDVFAPDASSTPRPQLIPLAEAAARCLPTARVGADGERRIGFGQAIPSAEIERTSDAPREGLHALLAADGALLAVAEIDAEGTARVTRGFPRPVSASSAGA